MNLRKNTQTDPQYEGKTITLKDKGSDEFEITIDSDTYQFNKDTILLRVMDKWV